MRTIKDIRVTVDAYIDSVVSGERPSCKWERLAIDRHIKRMDTKAFDFNWVRVKHHIGLIEMMPHVKGRWGTENLQLEDWQIFCLTDLLGWVNPNTGMQLHREGYFAVPRKNAKTTVFGSGLAITFMSIDGEPGPEIYSAATKRDQAGISWKIARDMLKKRKEIRERLGIWVPSGKYLGEITCEYNNGFFIPLSSDHDTQDGLNVYFGLVDEYHAHKDAGLYDVLITGVGSRIQSLIMVITTAGFNLDGPCYKHQRYVEKVLSGESENDYLWGMIYTIDEGDDPFDEVSWRKANPNYGVSFTTDQIKSEARKAKESEEKLVNFLTKHLNVWVSAAGSWINLQEWDELQNPGLNLEDLANFKLRLLSNG